MRPKLVIMFLLVLWPWTTVMADDQLSTIIEGVQKRYGALLGLAVSYEREVITRSMAVLGMQTQKDLASGMIYFRTPNSLKVQQETPDTEVVIINKDTLWWYIPRKKLVYKYPSHKLGQEMQLLSDIFQGLQQVESRFKVTLIADHTDMGVEIKLEPDPPWEQIDHIELWIDPGNYHIRIIEIYNYLGGLTRFTLGEPSARTVFDENFFNFLVPEGVTIIEEQS
jgi:outer membrane lipoprotein-sorting protein